MTLPTRTQSEVGVPGVEGDGRPVEARPFQATASNRTIGGLAGAAVDRFEALMPATDGRIG